MIRQAVMQIVLEEILKGETDQRPGEPFELRVQHVPDVDIYLI